MLREYLGHLAKSLEMRSQSLDRSLRHSSSQTVLSGFFCDLIIALAYLDSGKVKVKGIVNKTFTIDQWEECLESMRNKSAIKVLSSNLTINSRLLLCLSKAYGNGRGLESDNTCS
jgi:hypothetical protein